MPDTKAVEPLITINSKKAQKNALMAFFCAFRTRSVLNDIVALDFYQFYLSSESYMLSDNDDNAENFRLSGAVRQRGANVGRRFKHISDGGGISV